MSFTWQWMLFTRQSWWGKYEYQRRCFKTIAIKKGGDVGDLRFLVSLLQLMQASLLQRKRRGSTEPLFCFVTDFVFFFRVDSAMCAGSCKKLCNEGFAFLKEKSESLLPQEGEHENARERKLHCDSSAHVFILGPTKGQGDFWSWTSPIVMVILTGKHKC